jgi:hypothetical protein
MVSADRVHEERAETRSRRPVWQVLSELFLDTELGAADLERVAKILAGSPYSIQELESILLWEVYPACRSNLFWIAGEWAGFNEQWLEQRILRGPSLFMKAWTATLGRLSVHFSRKWKTIKQTIERERDGPRNAQ